MSADIVHVVDDDESVRDSLGALLVSAGYAVRLYASATAFLADPPAQQGCVVTDVRMPEMDGLELQEEILRRGLGYQVIVMTGHADVPLAVRAMRSGAADFIEKPFDDEVMLESIRRAIEIGRQTRDRLAEARAAQNLLALLTPREHHVFDQLVAGRSNKVAAYELGISPRTIEIHRARIMDKMNARSLSDLVRAALAAAAS
ncbi:MAG: response regulator transcription factor, partial [Alphaproteobacteria bacterium]|nr:response regulator transcription factor [Alphaproteobacteria bacterium]